MQLLLTASMLAAKTAAPAIRQRGRGAIILTASTSAFNLRSHIAPAYPVAKMVIARLTRIAALKYAADFIRFTSTRPGVCRRQFTKRSGTRPA